MAISHSEEAGNAQAAIEGNYTDGAALPCDQCLRRAFGVIALCKNGTVPQAAAALDTIHAAEETWTFSTRTRAAIYRCQVELCSHAVLSFTLAGAPGTPDPADLHVEQLPGTAACALPPDAQEQAR